MAASPASTLAATAEDPAPLDAAHDDVMQCSRSVKTRPARHEFMPYRRRSPSVDAFTAAMRGLEARTGRPTRNLRPVPLAELARAVGVSPTHLCKRFKQETGLTLSAYRLRQRIEKAKALLADRQRQVCEVAFAVGFGSAAYFNRVFRRVVGCPPSQYRLPSRPPRVPRRERTRSGKKDIIRA